MSREGKCKSCGEYHPSNTICPPHEVRMKAELGEQPDIELFKAWQNRAMKAEAELKAKDKEMERLSRALKKEGYDTNPMQSGPDIRD